VKYTDELRKHWQERAAANPAWWTQNYNAALERVEDHSGDPENPYWWAPADDASLTLEPSGPDIMGFDGASETPQQTRERAFELLVLADLADSGTADAPAQSVEAAPDA
jgi:hypothetical protein